MESPTTILVMTVGGAGFKTSVVEWGMCLGWWSTMSGWRIAENSEKEIKTPLRKCELPAAITVTMEVGACLKWKLKVRGIDLGSRPHRRWLAGTKKRSKDGGDGNL